MRDSLQLRSKIAMMAALSVSPGLAACAVPADPQPAADRERPPASREPDDEALAQREKYYRQKARKEGKTFEEVAPEHVLRSVKRRGAPAPDAAAASPDAPAPAPAVHTAPPAPARGDTRLAPVLGDPPFIEGYNPEEETCPSGNWCGAKADAMQITVPNIGIAEIGCPERVTGARPRDNPFPTGKAFDGISTKTTMQGSLNTHGSQLARARGGAADTCCYHWYEYCSGRPHLSADGPILADPRPGRGWQRGQEAPRPEHPPLAAVPAALRATIAAAWQRDALLEHASIAAFARATIELMAVGAPPDLVAGCQRAALDEIEHARQCWALAERYGAPATEPGGLAALGPRGGGMARLAADTFAEGCVGETVAALVAERAARHCQDPQAAATLAVIAADEARHAALAWSTVRWLLTQGGTPVADAVAQRLRSLRPNADASVPPPAQADALAAHGRLDPAALAQAQRDAWRDIIEPMIAPMLTAAQPASADALG